MSYDPGYILQQAMQDLPCCITLPGYNDAISLKAKLTRYIKSFEGDLNNPFENLEINVLKSGIIRFSRREEAPEIWKSPILGTE